MADPDLRPLSGHPRANWIRLRTMIFLRWFAIVGQLAAITVAQQVYGLRYREVRLEATTVLFRWFNPMVLQRVYNQKDQVLRAVALALK